jgi:pimeloyl-ACP methyl ester carboxylesterase
MNIVLIVIAVIFGVLLVGFLYETLSTLRDKQHYKTPPGRLVDVGGHRLHILIMGNREAGKPAIVMDSGVGNNLLDWQKVQPKLAEFAQAISYDRAGYGWSDKGRSSRTTKRIVEELHTLLHTAGIEPPYLLVGHSFGGIHVRMFAEKYSEKIAGLVLVDSSHPEMIAERNTEPELRRLQTVQRFQRFGIVRLMLQRGLSQTNQLAKDLRKQYLAFNLMSSWNVLHEAEPLFRDGVELSDSVIIPLTVISRAEDDELSAEKRWSEYQHKLAELSPEAKHIHAKTSSHWIALAEPDTVVTAIREMYENLS